MASGICITTGEPGTTWENQGCWDGLITGWYKAYFVKQVNDTENKMSKKACFF